MQRILGDTEFVSLMQFLRDFGPTSAEKQSALYQASSHILLGKIVK